MSGVDVVLAAVWVAVAVLIAADVTRLYRRSVRSADEGERIAAAVEAERDAAVREAAASRLVEAVRRGES